MFKIFFPVKKVNDSRNLFIKNVKYQKNTKIRLKYQPIIYNLQENDIGFELIIGLIGFY